jgi:AcrR family transcriptional regulator
VQNSLTAGRALRADAAQNRQRLAQAAREVFRERGLDAPLDEIACRAGLGPGTLYRRFSTREELVKAAFEDEWVNWEAVAEDALQCEDTESGFSMFIERICCAMAADRGFCDLIISKLPTSGAESFCERWTSTLRALVRRGQEAGALREDLVVEDVLLFLMANAGVMQVTRDAAPHAWRRLVAFLLEACRAADTGPLPAAPSPMQVDRAMREHASAFLCTRGTRTSD